MHKHRSRAIAAVLVTACAAFGLVAATARQSAHAAPLASPSCALQNGGGAVKHVIYLQFDNTHYRRDKPDVPSDLEQMPHLLNFLERNGTLFTNDHTILISHTAGGILSSLTGLYPDRNGQTVSNSYGYFKADGTVGFSQLVQVLDRPGRRGADPLPNMITDGAEDDAARRGCRSRAPAATSAASAPRTSSSRTRRRNATGDMTRVFGAGSPEWNEAGREPAARADRLRRHRDPLRAIADQPLRRRTRTRGRTTAARRAGRLRRLPGALRREVRQPGDHRRRAACVNDTDGDADPGPERATAASRASTGCSRRTRSARSRRCRRTACPSPTAYISDAHDIHVRTRQRLVHVERPGPGEADYQQQLKAYDDAFAAFFTNLRHDGIDKSNTLFVITVDEGDHFAGGIGSPDPRTRARWPTRTRPARDAQASSAARRTRSARSTRTCSALHAGAPTSRCTSTTRRPSTSTAIRGRAATRRCGASSTTLAEMKLLRSVRRARERRADRRRLRRPGRGDRRCTWSTTIRTGRRRSRCSGTTTSSSRPGRRGPTCGSNPCVAPGFAWNHGDIQEEIGNTWVGHRRAGCRRERRQRDDVDRPHEPASDDHGADRAEGRATARTASCSLRRSRPRGRHPRCSRRRRSPSSSGALRAAERAVRAVRDRHARRVDERDREQLHR